LAGCAEEFGMSLKWKGAAASCIIRLFSTALLFRQLERVQFKPVSGPKARFHISPAGWALGKQNHKG